MKGKEVNEKEIISLYKNTDFTIRKISYMVGIDHHRVKRILIKNSIVLTKRNYLKIKVLICPVCKKEFTTNINNDKQFCSTKCQYEARSLGISKRVVLKPYKLTGSYEKDKIKICLFCKKEYHCKAKKSKYCSKECCDKHKHIIQAGELNHQWKGGSSYRKRGYRGNEWETIRLEIYKRDKFSCVECGERCVGKRDSTETNSHLIIQCHHIDKDKTNNNIENLQTLCLGCHLDKHKKRNLV